MQFKNCTIAGVMYGETPVVPNENEIPVQVISPVEESKLADVSKLFFFFG